MFKKAITALITMSMTLISTGTFAGEAVKQPSIKKWQPKTSKVQTKQTKEVRAKKSGTVMERPTTINEQVMEQPTPANEQVMESQKVMENQKAQELQAGGQRQINKRIGPGPIS